jgi:hypothetical protein
MDNTTKCRDYYGRVKQDPEKLAALRARRAKNQRERRARLAPCSHPQPSVAARTAPVVTRRSPTAPEDRLHDNDAVVTPPVVTPTAAGSSVCVDPAALDLDFEERAAIMEYDGGLTRVEAEFEAAIRSTQPLVPVVTPDAATSLGGKHAATAAQGDMGLTADQIMEIWRQHWGA